MIALIGLTGLRAPHFFRAESLNSVLLWMPMVTVAAVGQLPVIVMRGIDISIGSILGFSGIAVGLIFKEYAALSLPLAFMAGAAAGALLGALNGALITFGKLPAIVVTIGTLTAFRGLTFLLSGGDQIDSSLLPNELTALAKDGLSVGPATISKLLLIALVIAILAALVLKFTQFGRNIFAYGNNPHAAYLRGMPVQRLNFLVYTFSGLTAGIAGVMYASRFGFVNPGSAGKNFELTVIAAVAIGGVKMTGGYGSVLGVILGCLFLSCLSVALTVLGINENWQLLTYGLVIIIAILIDYWLRLSKWGVVT